MPINGYLDLLEIMKAQIPNLDFAFPSTCQTSQWDLKLLDEAVHLTAGMLAAGYRSIMVGTMWSISDKHKSNFASATKYLFCKRLDSTGAIHALDHASWRNEERSKFKNLKRVISHFWPGSHRPTYTLWVLIFFLFYRHCYHTLILGLFMIVICT